MKKQTKKSEGLALNKTFTSWVNKKAQDFPNLDGSR